MPRITQSLNWLYINASAKFSISNNTPTTLWNTPTPADKINIKEANWYDINQAYILTFLINSHSSNNHYIPLYISFYFLNPQHYVVPFLDTMLEDIWKKAKITNIPSMLISLPQNHKSPILWSIIKYNRPDLLRLINARMYRNKRFIIPRTNLRAYPAGVTPPFYLFKKEIFKISPT